MHVSIFLIHLIPKIAAILLSFSFIFTLIIYSNELFFLKRGIESQLS